MAREGSVAMLGGRMSGSVEGHDISGSAGGHGIVGKIPFSH